MNIKTVRMINRDKVREVCIRNDYCTCADNEEYSEMLDMCTGEVNDEKLACIVEKIADQTDIKRLAYAHGSSEHEEIGAIAFNIVNDATYTLVDLAL